MAAKTLQLEDNLFSFKWFPLKKVVGFGYVQPWWVGVGFLLTYILLAVHLSQLIL